MAIYRPLALAIALLAAVFVAALPAASAARNGSGSNNRCAGLFQADAHETKEGYVVELENIAAAEYTIGFVDIHYAFTSSEDNETRDAPVEADRRMVKTSATGFASKFKYNDPSLAMPLTRDDTLRFFFRYWVVPRNAIDSGYMCTSPVEFLGPDAPKTEL